MNNIALKDYSEVNIDILANITPNDISKLNSYFNVNTNNETSEIELLKKLCHSIQTELDMSKAKNICFVNVSEKSPQLFYNYNNSVWTQGYIGVINYKINDVNITLNFNSRFDSSQNSRFLMYIFEKAFNIKGKLFDDMDLSGKTEFTWDFLLIITFIKQLHDAIKKGFYREYYKFEDNDSNPHGRIDIAKQIKNNFLSNGKIEYVSREYTIDNNINRLILTAFTYLDKKYHSLLTNIITKDEIVKSGLLTLNSNVFGWKDCSTQKLLKCTHKKIVQSVYKNYEPLRKTSIAILKRLGINAFCSGLSNVSGILIDMPNLWEEYLHNTIFKYIFNIYTPYSQKSYDILKGLRTIKPDFLWQDKKIVFDAKYKKSWGDTLLSPKKWDDNVREDIFQIFSYMLIFQCDYGASIFPVENQSIYSDLTDYMHPIEISQQCINKFFIRIPYFIPSVEKSNHDFKEKIKENESNIIAELNKILNNN